MFGQGKVFASTVVRSVLLASIAGCLLLSAAPSFAATGDCNSCHGTNTSASHHQSELYSQGLCHQCHEGVTTNGDCATCHTFVPQQNNHHDTVAATSGNCAECHTNVGDLADCLTCHQGKIRTPHHNAAADPTSPIDCASCHTNMEPLTGCVGCHTGSIQNTHHTAANTESISCDSCHAGIEPVVNCESCHNPTDYAAWGGQSAQQAHHSTAAAQADCTTCHTNAPRPFNCHDCHQGEAAGRHHVLLGGTLTCNNCHDSIVVDVKDAATDCQNCHAPSAANQQQHHDMAVADPTLTCNTCHSDAGDVPGCATCHDAAYWGVDANNEPLTARDAHHAFTVDPAIDCNSCHTSMVFDNSCDACHSSGDLSLREHHNPDNPSIPSNLACGFCHGPGADVPDVAGDPDASCLFCHDASFWTANNRAGSSINQHHDVVLGSGTITDCSNCHDTLVPQTCATCHDNAFWTDAGRAGSAEAQHHDVVRPTDGLACAECHAGGLPGENNDCQACHSDDGTETRDFHHDTVAPGPPGVSCQACHTALPEVADCESCHTSGSWAVDPRTDHHNSPSFNGTDCTQCHSGVSLGQDCENCHTPELWTVSAKDDHHEVAMTNGTNCNTCHDSITTPSGNCRACHGDDWTTIDPATGNVVALPDPNYPNDPTKKMPNLHHDTEDYSFGCLSCHKYGPNWILLMPTDASCETCHSTQIVGKDGSSVMHHLTPPATSNQCGECHAGIENITPASLDCATCHSGQSAGNNGSPAMHHTTQAYGANQCGTCHTDITQASLDCETCHTSQTAVAGLDGTPLMHHATPDADTNCASCHQNVVALDCAGCHIDPSDTTLVPIPQRHHDRFEQDPNITTCAQCHTGADVAIGNCELCHVGNGQPEVSDRHHATPSYTPGNCVVCHEGIDGVSGDALDCAVCHADKARNGDTAMHHQTIDGQPNYAVDNCATCHNVLNFEQLVAADECFSCHTGGNAAIIEGRHHATAPAQADNCAACHTVAQAELDCATCHASQPVLDGKAPMHHATDTASSGVCTDCHATVNVTNVTCASCHASQPVLNGGLEMHHATTEFTAGDCTFCHTGADSALMDCAGCHVDPANPDPNQVSDRHHGSIYAQSAACTDCHTAVNTNELDCELCHASQPVTLNGSVTMHHDLTIAGTTNACATCHQGVTVSEGDCSTCHLSPEKPPIAEIHHATETANTGLCSACHVGTDLQSTVCATCHGQDSNHHIQPQYVSSDCNFCHTDITLNGANCESCHAAPGEPTIPETHHAVPLANVGGDCGVCHQSVSTPDVCSNCHVSSPHHTSTWSQMGDCAHCHTVPAAVQDRPAQAACRECHGSNMHDKGGAIQNFGACADCHNTVPFHSKPSYPPGYSVMVGGKGKFNIFWSAMTNGGEKEIREDVRPNGEDMRDKGGDRRYGSPTISFDWYTIEYGGKNYQVPGFSPPADYTSGDLNSCTSCHADRSDMVACDNSKWTDHLSTGRVNLATYQLAEATYIGSLCSGTTPPGGGESDVDAGGTYVEAEDFSSRGDNFSEQSSSSANGDKYLRAEDNNTGSPRGSSAQYRLNFSETGTYYLWFRGNSNGSSSDNSLWYGLNGSTVGNANFSTSSGYRWTRSYYNNGPNPTRISISSTGEHTINVWAREDGLRFDGFYLTKSSSSSIPGGTYVGVPDGAKTAVGK